MYAIIKTGGKQYKVSAGDVIEVEHLKAKEGSVSMSPILVVTDDGKTMSSGADLKAHPVKAKLLGDAKGDKVTVFKYRSKSGYSAKSGHRQLYSLIEIESIGDQKAPAKAGQAAKKKPAEPAEPAAKEAPTEPAPAAEQG